MDGIENNGANSHHSQFGTVETVTHAGMEQYATELVELIHERYPDWDSFTHAPFVADEITYKRKVAKQARQLLGRGPLQQLLDEQAYDEIIGRIERIGRMTNLLYNAQPSSGDLRILYADNLDKATFCTQFNDLLHSRDPIEARFDRYVKALFSLNLPNTWAFPTFFLFLLHPSAEFFVKPTAAEWFLRFVGVGDVYQPVPSGQIYGLIRKNAHALKAALAEFKPRDMIDVQSLIWVAHRESKARIGRLNTKGQIELGVPVMREPNSSYLAETDENQSQQGPGNMTKTDLLSATSIGEDLIDAMLAGLQRKGQIVLYGPPGTGKTFLARKLAAYLTNGDDSRQDLVQFHPAYAYEDFVEGIRPKTHAGQLSYDLVPGRFRQFCDRARQRPDDIFVLIIDEINRANLSRVFGELMYLLEYRDETIKLAHGTPFSIPRNVRIIGTMNTADRSIALVDHALRRRFAFIHLQPNFDLLRRFHAATGYPVEPLITLLQELNADIGDSNYAVGVSFFLVPDLAVYLPDIWRLEIEPYLEEHFFGNTELMRRYRWGAVTSKLA